MGADQSWQVTNIPICLIPVISDLEDTQTPICLPATLQWLIFLTLR
jgi:hypothetical protein